jgi:hypothetical protein
MLDWDTTPSLSMSLGTVHECMPFAQFTHGGRPFS